MAQGYQAQQIGDENRVLNYPKLKKGSDFEGYSRYANRCFVDDPALLVVVCWR